MNGGSRIVAFGPGGEPALPEDHTTTAPDAEEQTWLEEADHAAASGAREWLAPAFAIATIVGWTGFFGWAQRDVLANGIAPLDAIALLGSWAMPVILVCALWLIALRTSRREAVRFADAAAALSAQSRELEARLTVVNRELSLAREFLAAQARDLDSLGRVAVERISEHAGRLQELVADNAGQVESIAAVSTTALENMDRLRGQLPVVASSARDVANNIGHAGRTAQGALEQLSTAFDRLALSGSDSAEKVDGIGNRVERTLELFQQRLDQLQSAVGHRIEELEQRGEDLRSRLAATEHTAFAAIGDRTDELARQVDAVRERLDGHEAEALTSLRARLGMLRDEAGSLSRALREGEAAAVHAFDETRARVEADIRAMIERLDKLDREALDAARTRIETLTREAGDFDERLAERNRLFLTETNQRLDEAAVRHDAEVARLAELLAKLDNELDARRQAQGRRQQDLADASDAIATRLESLSDRIAAVAAYGTQAEETLGNGLRLLTERLTASRDALSGTDAAIDQLTDSAVRLLELLQASADQSREQLPAALATGETRLVEWETRVTALRDALDAAVSRAGELDGSVSGTHADLSATLAGLDEAQDRLVRGAGDHADTLATLGTALAALDRDSRALADDAQSRLTAALDQLATATRAALATLDEDAADTVQSLAGRIGAQSAEAIDRALRQRLAEAIGQLDQAAGHAAGVSREAAIQLRDQLAKVDELTGNLERRVNQARERAEEQVDNDFSRRVALITESLNSNAIDIAKALSTEVTDTAWAAYLRGDRGVFTRRAVKLVDASEAREIASIYENDGEFRGHVSRYIHDFEAMLRMLLSTRDGHSLGVTLLSSDMGKLYVVLAQAIERLRS